MRLHHGDKSSVVHLNATDAVVDNQRLPYVIGGRIFMKDVKKAFQLRDLVAGFLSRNPSPLLDAGRVATFQNSATF